MGLVFCIEKQWFMGLVSVKRVSCYIVDYKVSDAKDRLLVFTPVRNYARRQSGGDSGPIELSKNRGLIGVYARTSFYYYYIYNNI